MNELDGDLAAIAELHRRRNRVTNFLGVGCVSVGLVVTGLLFLLLVKIQFHYLGAAYLSWTMVVAALAGIGGSVQAGFVLRGVILRARASSWIGELAANHQDRRRELEQIASLWR